MGNSTLVQQGVEPSSSLNEDEIGNMWKNTKLTKKDSRSACDLRDHTDTTPYRKIFENFKFISKKNVLRFSRLRYNADFRRSRLVFAYAWCLRTPVVWW